MLNIIINPLEGHDSFEGVVEDADFADGFLGWLALARVCNCLIRISAFDEEGISFTFVERGEFGIELSAVEISRKEGMGLVYTQFAKAIEGNEEHGLFVCGNPEAQPRLQRLLAPHLKTQ